MPEIIKLTAGQTKAMDQFIKEFKKIDRAMVCDGDDFAHRQFDSALRRMIYSVAAEAIRPEPKKEGTPDRREFPEFKLARSIVNTLTPVFRSLTDEEAKLLEIAQNILPTKS